MTRTAPSTVTTQFANRRGQVIDVGTALDLLARVVDDRGEDFTYDPVANPSHQHGGYVYAFDGRPQCIVGHALARASVDVTRLEEMRDEHLRDLYRDGKLPVVLSLGALIALDAAQRSQDRGRTWGAALDDATAAAARYFDLVAVVPEVTHYLDRCAKRCRLLDSAAKE
jgi:hypothetical protein